MSRRSFWIYSTVAVAGCVLGAFLAVSTIDSGIEKPSRPFATHQPAADSPAPTKHRPRAQAVAPVDAKRPRLKLSPLLSLSPLRASDAVAAKASKSGQSNKTARVELSPSAPLDLALPGDMGSGILSSDHDDDVSKPKLEIDLSQPDSPKPKKVETAKLFNHENGLRGFMTQSWVNSRIGVQGGLALKEDRLREDNSDLRDNVAVGMGVLLAF